MSYLLLWIISLNPPHNNPLPTKNRAPPLPGGKPIPQVKMLPNPNQRTPQANPWTS